jgi:phosphoglycerol transferase MdoB-like AlkP superfamily enzyme
VLALITLVAVRGGVQASPLRWGDAYFSQNTYVNQMTENGLFSLINALRHSSGNKLAKKWLRQMPAEEAIQHLRDITLLPGEKLVAPEKYPLLRTSPPNDIAVKRPRNVVLVLMESFSARMCGAVGADFKATPNYDALAREGILFDRGFSCGSHTAQGVFATLCSFPSLPDFDGVMKESLGQQNFRTLPAIFGENGYETLFLYNGLFSWDNKEGFFRHQGVQRFIGRNDYKNPAFMDPAWGVCDLDVFNRAIDEFSAIVDRKKPFFGIVLTLSNHSPFNLPKVDGLEHIEGGGDQNQRLNGIHYADWALGQFMAMARKQSWFNETLFVFSGDHGFSVPPGLTDITLLRMHVPILFYGPEILGGRHEVRHQTIGHLDILPTILGTAGLESTHQSFGRDVFRLPPEDPGHAYVKRTGDPMVGWISGDKLMVGRAGPPSTLHHLDLGFPPSASEDLSAKDPASADKFAKDVNAFVVTGLHTLQSRVAAPR